MSSTAWDVWCSKEDPGSLWLGYHIARALTHHRESARLITDDLQELSAGLQNIDPSLWLQSHDAGIIVDERISGFISPSPNLVQVFNTPVSKGYIRRFISQESHGNWFNVVPPWQRIEQDQPVASIEKTSSYRRLFVRMGDMPQSAGYARHYAAPVVSRGPGAWLRRARSGILNLLGVQQEVLDHENFYVLTGEVPVSLDGVIEKLSASGTRACIFVLPGDLQHLPNSTMLSPENVGSHSVGSLTVVFLPQIMWHVVDELIELADLVLTTRADMAMRAAECGTPVILGADVARLAPVLGWYAPSLSAGQRRIYTQVATWLGGHNNVFNTSWFEVEGFLPGLRNSAIAIQERISASPDLADVLLAFSTRGGSPKLEMLFAPTMPNEFLED